MCSRPLHHVGGRVRAASASSGARSSPWTPSRRPHPSPPLQDQHSIGLSLEQDAIRDIRVRWVDDNANVAVQDHLVGEGIVDGYGPRIVGLKSRASAVWMRRMASTTGASVGPTSNPRAPSSSCWKWAPFMRSRPLPSRLHPRARASHPAFLGRRVFGAGAASSLSNSSNDVLVCFRRASIIFQKFGSSINMMSSRSWPSTPITTLLGLPWFMTTTPFLQHSRDLTLVCSAEVTQRDPG